MEEGGRSKNGMNVPLGLSRPSYEVGDRLCRGQMRDEQFHMCQSLRRHNRYLHSWGVVCGLRIVAIGEAPRPWAIRVCPGYAIGRCGDEIQVQTSVAVDIYDYLWTRPMDGGHLAIVAYVAIRYAEEYTEPIPSRTPTCGCGGDDYEPSRIRDGFQLSIEWELPKVQDQPAVDLCAQATAPCPDCPSSPDIVLASITLPLSECDPITNDRIDNWSLRHLL
jgi:hypothetical protein